MTPARLAAALAATLLATGVAGAQEKVVNVYNWSDYIDESILADFTKETGIKVVYDVFDSNELLETKLLAGGGGYDLVVPSSNFLARQIAAGVFQPLDKAKLPNLKNMWPKIMEAVAEADPGNAYSVNYMWGTTGFGYNAAKIAERMKDAPVDSWAMLFDPAVVAKFQDCGVMMLDAPSEVIPAALNYLGLSPQSTEPADLEKAEALLKSVAPFVRKFHSSEYISALAGGDACLAMGFSGDVLQARERAKEAKNGVEIAYVIPKEGAQYGFDQLAIPANAEHVEEAYALINFLMRPEVIAKASNAVFFANGNLAAQPLLSPEIRDDRSIYPDEATQARLYYVPPYDARTQRAVTRAFTSVKTGQ